MVSQRLARGRDKSVAVEKGYTVLHRYYSTPLNIAFGAAGFSAINDNETTRTEAERWTRAAFSSFRPVRYQAWQLRNERV